MVDTNGSRYQGDDNLTRIEKRRNDLVTYPGTSTSFDVVLDVLLCKRRSCSTHVREKSGRHVRLLMFRTEANDSLSALLLSETLCEWTCGCVPFSFDMGLFCSWEHEV
jgi:hypothetical protein